MVRFGFRRFEPWAISVADAGPFALRPRPFLALFAVKGFSHEIF